MNGYSYICYARGTRRGRNPKLQNTIGWTRKSQRRAFALQPAPGIQGMEANCTVMLRLLQERRLEVVEKDEK